MNVTCIVLNEKKEPIERASVKLLISKKDSYELKYDSIAKVYVADIDIRLGIMVSIDVTSEGYEPAKFNQRIDDDTIVVTLGGVGSKYVRCGKYKLPYREYIDLIGIYSISEKGQQVIRNLDLEPVAEYEGKKLNSGKFFQFKLEVLKGKTKKEKQKIHKNILKALRKAEDVRELGIIHNIEFGGDIYTNVIIATPLSK